MKDLIKERNERERMQNSIVKWWNVHYMTPEELRAAQKDDDGAAALSAQPQQAGGETQQLQVVEEELQAAEEIIGRLQREAELDEVHKRQEIEQARQETEANYNPTTGAYSGTYGTGQVDEENDGQIQEILSQKDEALRELIEHTGEE